MLKPQQAKESMQDMPFPVKGVDLSSAYGLQPQGTTPLGINVRAFEPLTARARGGQRPGLSRYINQTVNGVALIQDINVVVGVGYTAPGG